MKQITLNHKLKNLITESTDKVWYHGTPDARDVEKTGGFSQRTQTYTYINDLKKFEDLKEKLAQAENGSKEYMRYLDQMPTVKSKFNASRPIFFSDNKFVAKSYADPQRAFDYQRAEEKVFKARINEGKKLVINALGANFRFISEERMESALTKAGIPQEKTENVLDSFNFVTRGKGVKTDMIAAIAQFLGFDSVEVKNVLDSYDGGRTKSNVLMVFNPKDIQIIKDVS